MKRFAFSTLIVGAGLLGLASCRSGASGTPGSPSSPLRTAESRPDIDATLNDVEAWVVRVTSEAAPANRERVEVLAENLRGYEERVKASLRHKRGERMDDTVLSRDVNDLRNAYDHAIASLPAERRAAETAMGEALADVGDRLTQFRIAVASAGVQGNAEMKRRMTELELGRREISETLADLRRASTDTWAEIHRRWELQLRRWNEEFQEAQTRLPLMPTPEPSGSPTPVPRRRSIAH